MAAAGAMVVALTPAAALAQDADIEPIGTEDVCPPPDGAADFPDATGVHEDNIQCIGGYGIVQGEDGNYMPAEDVTRAQMATFIANEIETALGEDLPTGDNAFPDDDGNVHESNINKLAEAGIVVGDEGNYDPSDNVSRAQMATYIANAIDYHDDQDVNDSLPPATDTNYFPDDDGNVHESNINRIAGQGIVQGEDGDYNPTNDVSRAQMATFIMHTAEYAEQNGVWAPTAETSNQTFDVTPDDQAVLNASATALTNEGQRQYTVENPVADTEHTIALLPSENVTIDENGVVSFADDNADNEADDLGGTAANIEQVNGEATNRADLQTATPENGELTFTVDSTTADEVIPVVFADADEEGDLDLDDDGLPVDDEVFGVGGETIWVPAEAADGAPAADQSVDTVNAADNFFTTDGPATYYYSGADAFYIDGSDGSATDGVCGAAEAVAQSVFETNLSTADVLLAPAAASLGTVYENENDDDTGASSFCLSDDEPAGPTAVATALSTSQPDTAVLVSWTPETAPELDSQNIYRSDDVAAATACDAVEMDDYALLEELAADADEYADEGLEADTKYCYLVTSVDDGDESGITAATTEAATTQAEVDRATITDAQLTNDAILIGAADTNDEWELRFDEDMADALDNGVATTAFFEVTDGDGDLAVIACTGVAAADTDTDATCALTDEAPGTDNLLTVTLLEGATDQNAAGDGQLEYPLTITDTTNVTDEDDGVEVDLDASSDVTIDDES